MKIGTITFHGSHNYGSVLQAYALQKFTVELFREHGAPCDYEIINYRSRTQKSIYELPRPDSMKGLVKWGMSLPYRKGLHTQYQRFESFINDRLQLSEEFNDAGKLGNRVLRYDVLMAGSDQIWNIRSLDFSYAYLFEGCDNKKISYAASLGPLPINWEKYDKERYGRLIDGFDTLSVRERQSARLLQIPAVNRKPEVLVDPTLLMSVSEWRKIQSNMDPGRYILFYCLEPKNVHLKMAKQLSELTGLKVVITGYRNKWDYINTFEKKYEAGPEDFLSLIDHAAVILTSSFHGTAFSLIYEKPFYVIDGMRDGRIRDLLALVGAEQNDISPGTTIKHLPKPVTGAENVFRRERQRSREYLVKALGL